MARGLARDFGPRGITINSSSQGQLIPTLIPPTGQCAIVAWFYGYQKTWATGRGRWYVAWLAGPEASFVTGAMHTIDARLAHNRLRSIKPSHFP